MIQFTLLYTLLTGALLCSQGLRPGGQNPTEVAEQRISSFPMAQAFSEGPGYLRPTCLCRAQIETVRERGFCPYVGGHSSGSACGLLYMRLPMALSYRVHPAGHLQDGGQGRQICTTWGLGTRLCQRPGCSCVVPRERKLLLARGWDDSFRLWRPWGWEDCDLRSRSCLRSW